MAVGGENIGRAYIKILADGKGLDKDIRDDLDDIDWNQYGRKGADEWAKGWKEEFSKSHNQKVLQEAIAKPLTRGKYLTETYFRSDTWRDFRAGLERQYGLAGKRAGESLQRQIAAGIDVRKQLDNMLPLIRQMEEQVESESKANAQRITATRLRIEKHFQQETAELQRKGVTQERALVMNRIQMLKRLENQYVRLQDAQSGTKVGASRRQMVEDFHLLRTEIERGGDVSYTTTHRLNEMDRQFIHMHPNIDRANRGISGFSDIVGVSFGRGSRNNFLNFMGSMARNIVRIPMLFTKAGGALTSWVRGISSASGGMAKMSAAFKPLMKSGWAVIGVLVAMAAAVGPIVSMFSMLLGVVVALGSTVAYAAAAGISAIGGAAVVAGFGIGVLALAIANMPKKAKVALKQVKNEFTALGKSAAEGVFSNIQNQAWRFAMQIRAWRPIVEDVGAAISRVGDHWLDAMQSPGFKQFRNAMSTFLPHAVESLGRSFGNFLGGMGGVFRAMIPMLNRFFAWLQKITGEFARWANSAKGQRQLMHFFKEAGDSAKQLGGFLKAVGRLLGTIMSAGKGAGDSLFGSMTNKINEWTAALKRDPDILKRWFEDARKFGENIGRAAEAVGKLMDALDSPAARMFAQLFIMPAIHGLELLSKALNIVTKSWQDLVHGIGWLASKLGALPGAPKWLDKMGKDMQNAGKATRELGDSAGSATGPLGNLNDTLDQSSGAATRATREWALAKLRANGVVEAYKKVGGSTRDLISASLGNAGAMKRVNAVLRENPALAKKIAPLLRAMGITFRETSEKARLNAREMNQWAEAVRGLPPAVRMKVSAEGMPRTLGQFRDLVRDIKLTPKQVKTLVRASGVKVTEKQLNGLIRTAKNFGKQRPHAKPDVDTKKPKGQMSSLMRLLGVLGRQKPKPKPDVQDRKPKSAITALMRSLGVLGKQKPKPRPDVIDRPANSAIRTLLSRLGDLGRKHPRPTVSVNDNASSRINSIRGLLSAIPRSVTSTITTIRKAITGADGLIAPAGLGERVQRLAAGGIVRNRTFTKNGYEIGEAGAEAVVPLHRPLSQVDPAVRWLSAIAQGITPLATGGVVGSGRTVNVGGITVNSPSADPRAVAMQTVNELVGKAY